VFDSGHAIICLFLQSSGIGTAFLILTGAAHAIAALVGFCLLGTVHHATPGLIVDLVQTAISKTGAYGIKYMAFILEELQKPLEVSRRT
jgi:hypothetical protein